jgi:DNA polymerase
MVMDGLEVPECTRCEALVDSRSRIVNGVGPADAELMFVGEAPGRREDERGEPFVGRSGSVLDDALRERGLARADVRISNCVRCRPPENRDPTLAELDNCSGYMANEIAAVDPAVVVTLGKVPSEHLLDRPVAVTNEAGDVDEFRTDAGAWPLVICVHPAATLYDRSQEETFAHALDEAVALAGEGGGDQSRLGEF